ncbi:MAG: DUF309 domain-containing protein [Anaerolineae bacterium]|nr:DUF309 domain-containing protein [Anaerolineae bacterium]
MSDIVVVILSDSEWGEELVSIESSCRVVRYPLTSDAEGYVRRLAADLPAVIVVDGSRSDWRRWVTASKTSPATRRIPVALVADDPALVAAGRDAGADDVLPLTGLGQALSCLLARREQGRRQVSAALESQCAEPLPPEALEGIRRFNAGEYYRQHDLFEALWMVERGPVRDLYRAILQVGVAYYQITRGNHRGALKMLLRSLQWLAPLPDICQGVDVAGLRADVAQVRAALEGMAPEEIAQFDRSLLRPVRLINGEGRDSSIAESKDTGEEESSHGG